MRLPKWITGFILGVLLSGVAWATVIPAGEYETRGKYVGVLPCSDCAGVWTEVTLYDPGMDAGQGSGTFVMSQRFTGGSHGGQTIITRGTWSQASQNLIYGNGIILRDGSRGTLRYFDCDHGRSLQLLDAQRQVPRSETPSVLHRVIPLPAHRFGPLTEAMAGTTVALEVGDAVMLRLPADDLRATLTAWRPVRPIGAAVAVYSVTGGGQGTRYWTEIEVRAMHAGTQTVTVRNTSDSSREVMFKFVVTKSAEATRKCE